MHAKLGKNVRGVIFDLDGTLVDTMPLHRLAWDILADKHGLAFDADTLIAANGKTTISHIRDVFKWTDDPEKIQMLASDKRHIFAQLVQERGVEAIEGLHGFLESLRKLAIPTAVGTSAPRENVALLLEKARVSHKFQAIVGAQDVTNGKPHPEVFLNGALGLGVDPAHCVVFEDAATGIAAGKAAGMRVIALTTTHTPEQLQQADHVIDSYLELIQSLNPD